MKGIVTPTYSVMSSWVKTELAFREQCFVFYHVDIQTALFTVQHLLLVLRYMVGIIFPIKSLYSEKLRKCHFWLRQKKRLFTQKEIGIRSVPNRIWAQSLSLTALIHCLASFWAKQQTVAGHEENQNKKPKPNSSDWDSNSTAVIPAIKRSTAINHDLFD